MKAKVIVPLILLFLAAGAATIVYTVAFGPELSGRSDKEQARKDVEHIKSAIEAYYQFYGKLPGTPRKEDQMLHKRYDRLFATLTGKDPIGNPKNEVFYEAAQIPPMDAWGFPYRILVDTNYDQLLSPGGKSLNASVAVWSVGRNGVDESGGGDDLASF